MRPLSTHRLMPACANVIDHVHAWCNSFIASDEDLRGTVDAVEEVIVPDDDVFDDIDNATAEQEMLIVESDDSDDELPNNPT